MTNKAMTYIQALILLVVWSAGLAGARPHRVPSADLLLPYFEIDLAGSGPTTLFAVVNSSTQQVPVKMSVHSNWGIEIMTSSVLLGSREVVTVNLQNWILDGELPDAIRENVLAYVGCVAGAERRERYFEMLEEAGFGEVEILKDVDFLEMTEKASPAEVISIMEQNGIERSDVAGIVRSVTYRAKKS